MSLIKIEDLYKTYRLGLVEVPVLRGVSLNIESGEFVAVMGRSGSGKSTLMNILGCLDVPSSGRYILEGNTVDSMNDNQLSELRSQFIGFIFQQFHLIKYLNVLDNVKLPLEFVGMSNKKAEEKALEWLKKVRMDHRLDHLPKQLSGGERQRVAIARALVKSPSMILADEPTGNLDEKVGREILDLFKELNQELGITTIMVTHSPELARQSQRIITIIDGKIS